MAIPFDPYYTTKHRLQRDHRLKKSKFTKIFKVALFVGEKNWKPSRCLLNGKRSNKLWYMNIIKIFLCCKKWQRGIQRSMGRFTWKNEEQSSQENNINKDYNIVKGKNHKTIKSECCKLKRKNMFFGPKEEIWEDTSHYSLAGVRGPQVWNTACIFRFVSIYWATG